jgi:signal transduction histidine kinase
VVLDSFDKGFAPYEPLKAAFRNELKDKSPHALAFYELSIPRDRDEESFLNSVLSTFKGQKLDLIVTLGGTAATFAQKHRDRFFASTPLLFASVDEHWLKGVTPNSTAVAMRNDFPGTIEKILHLIPATKCIAVVLGNSVLEQFWRKELAREFERFENRLTFTWLDNLSFAEVLDRSATLPANTVIFYVALAVDAKGITRSQQTVISELHARANAPIFALNGLAGEGIVGGLVTNGEAIGRQTAAIAVRLLNGEAAESIKVTPREPVQGMFDWRELRRWNIDDNRLPPGSDIRFRRSTAWDEYKWYVIVGGALSLIELMLVAGLALNVFKRKRLERSLREAEKLARDFGRQLIQAQEAERSRLARELHDDITQRLACLAIETNQKSEAVQERAMTESMDAIHEEIVQVAEAVRSLAHQLHPSLLGYTGLSSALKTECEKFSRQAGIAVDAKFQNVPDNLPTGAALCLFRVAQEALRNVHRHSKAKSVAVRLNGEKERLQLVITDDGVGFDPNEHRGASLGLASMRERVQLLGGRIEIQSQTGHGTIISAWTPFIEGDNAT